MKIGIIGCGAAGMTAAIAAAKEGAQVTVFEQRERVGKKILSTGNGKCNLSNLEFGTDYYYCSDEDKLHKMFRVFSPWDTVTFFEDAGLMVREKNGYLYPYCEQASAVLDVLRMQMDKAGVCVVSEAEVHSAGYREKDACFCVKAAGKEYCFDKLILACGSPASLKSGEGRSGYELAKGFGHKINSLVPGLCGLRSDESFVKALAGVRAQAKIELLSDDKILAQETGEVQFTDYGVSGIPVFQVSRLASYACQKGENVRVRIDFFPEQDAAAYEFMGKLRFETQKEKTLENYMIGVLNKKINMVLIKEAGCKPSMTAEEAGFGKVSEIMKLCRNLTMHITEPGQIENAQICAGGVDFAQISTEMESMLIKGLYFAGEMVDVDGKCGGYNLQWAWTSGYIAGKNAAGYSTEDIANATEGTEGC